MVAAAFLLALIDSSYAWQGCDDVDVVEINHVCQDNGEVAFTQIVLWRWMHAFPSSRHHVSEWFLVTGQEIMVQRKGTRRRVTWRGRGGTVYQADARTVRETRTVYDPEIEDRKLLPTKYRKPYFDQKTLNAPAEPVIGSE